MKYGSFIALIALVVLSLSSCKKGQIEIPEENDPVFMIEGTLGSETISLIAGDNNAYMFTSTKMENGVRLFSGEISDGSTSIEMSIFDGNLDMPGHIPEIDLASVALNFAKRSNDPLIVLSKEGLDQNQNISSIVWYINGTSTYAEEAPIYEPGKYDVCALVKFYGSTETQQLCDEIIIGYQRSANCYINFSIANNTLGANIISTGAGIESVSWQLDGAPFGDEEQLLQETIDSNAHILTAKVTFENGVVREKSCLINGGNPLQSIHDFSIFEITSGSNFANQDYRVKLKVRHAGHEYKTVLANNENSSVNLLGIEYFGKNANDKDVYKATVQIQAIVMDVVTEKLVPINFTATLGIEVP